jgi:hypothetical protein
MQITIDTTEITAEEFNALGALLGFSLEGDGATEPEKKAAAKPPAKKTTAKKKAAEKPEPIAEEPVEEDEEAEDEEAEVDDETSDDETSDEDLLALAVKKATEMVAGGDAAKVREALDAAGAARVRELNADNVRDFFKALS